jgi:hypothetical protein
MLTISMTTPKGLETFDWDASAEEFKRLRDHCETLAANNKIEPQHMAQAVIQSFGSQDYDPVQARGQRVWVVYAVLGMLHQAAPKTDKTGEPLTIFDIAALQHIEAKISCVKRNKFEVQFTGHATPLDS